MTCGCVAVADGDEPVWQQLVRLQLDHQVHPDPQVAQQAAAALVDTQIEHSPYPLCSDSDSD